MKQLLSQADVRAGVERLAREVAAAYKGRPLTIVGVMTGSLVLLADLIRLLDMPLRVGVVQASSYHGGTTPGSLTVNVQMLPDIAGRDVLLVDDIFDTGHTLVEVVRLMNELRPKSLRAAVLLKKRGKCQVQRQPDFAAFEIPDEFVVGYGLDYRDEYRNLPYVATLEPADLLDQSA